MVFGRRSQQSGRVDERTRDSALKAARDNDDDTLRRLVEKEEVELDAVRASERGTLLHVASAAGSSAALAALLRSPRLLRKLESRDRGRRTALHWAAAMGYPRCIEMLVAAGASLEPLDVDSCTPLLLAIRFEWPDAAYALLAAHANPLAEDAFGRNAVDLAGSSSDERVGSLAAKLRGLGLQRQQASLLKCMLPPWLRRHGSSARKSLRLDDIKPDERSTSEEEAEDVPHSPGDKKDLASLPAPPAPPGQEEAYVQLSLPKALEKAALKLKVPEDSLDVGAIDLAFGGAGDVPDSPISVLDALPASPGDGATAARLSDSEPPLLCHASGGSSGSRAAPPRGAADASDEVFAFSIFFKEDTSRLDFEMEWREGDPLVGKVFRAGAAERAGLLSGDRVVQIGGTPTGGRSRDELLPLLKARPLWLSIERLMPIDSDENHCELDLRVAASAKHGASRAGGALAVTLCGQLPVVHSVRPGSDAAAAGVLEGDALVEANGRALRDIARDALAAMLDERLLQLRLWRRPVGSERFEPWLLGGAGAEAPRDPSPVPRRAEQTPQQQHHAQQLQQHSAAEDAAAPARAAAAAPAADANADEDDELADDMPHRENSFVSFVDVECAHAR